MFLEKGYKTLIFRVLFSAMALGVFSANADLTITPGTEQSVCSGDAVEFSANVSDETEEVFYAWSGPNFFSTNSQSISVGVPGKYSVTVTRSNGTIYGTACATLHLKERPLVKVAWPSPLTCKTLEVKLFARTTATNALFHWNGPGIIAGADSATPTVNIPGTYQVFVTALNGCVGSTNVVVVENRTAPQFAISEPTLVYPSRHISLTASTTNRYDYTWTGPGVVTGSNSVTCTVNAPGLYTVVATSRQMPIFTHALADGGTIDFNGAVTTDSFNATDSTTYTNRYAGGSTNVGDEEGDIWNPVGPNYPGDISWGDSSYSSCADAPSPTIISQNGVVRPLYPPPYFGGHFTFHYDEDLSYFGPTNGNGCSTTGTVYVAEEWFTPSDNDDDGVADDWENHYGLNVAAKDSDADIDGDGASNLVEFRNGTDPRVFQNFFCLGITSSSTAGKSTINFHTLSGRLYTLEHSSDLAGDSWSELLSIPATEAKPIHLTNNTTSGAVFYRLRIEQQSGINP